jgi:hypothetical protein
MSENQPIESKEKYLDFEPTNESFGQASSSHVVHYMAHTLGEKGSA